MSNGGGFRYTAASREAREYGYRLLGLTTDYEEAVLRADTPMPFVGIVGLVARSRHLLKVALREADVGDAVASAIALRGLTETLFTIAWLDIDLEIAYRVWVLDEIRSRLSQHEEVRRYERNRRRRAKRHGKKVKPLAGGETLGLLARSSLVRFRRQQSEVRKQVQALPGRKRRLKRLRVERVNKTPTFQQRALAAGLGDLYSLLYRFDSNSAAHPNALAIQQFLEETPAGIVVRATPQGPRPDPYVVADAWFLGVLERAKKYVDQAAIEAALKEITKALARLPKPRFGQRFPLRRMVPPFATGSHRPGADHERRAPGGNASHHRRPPRCIVGSASHLRRYTMSELYDREEQRRMEHAAVALNRKEGDDA